MDATYKLSEKSIVAGSLKTDAGVGIQMFWRRDGLSARGGLWFELWIWPRPSRWNLYSTSSVFDRNRMCLRGGLGRWIIFFRRQAEVGEWQMIHLLVCVFAYD